MLYSEDVWAVLLTIFYLGSNLINALVFSASIATNRVTKVVCKKVYSRKS